jgi:predicted ester cyclase
MLSDSILGLFKLLLPAALLPFALGACATAPVPAAASANRALVLRYFNDLWNRGDAAVADEIIAPDVVGHVNSMTLHHRQALKDRVQALGKIYTASVFTVDAVVADQDGVAVRWTQRATHSGTFLGPQTAGKSVTVTGTNLFRIAGDRIVEIWVNSDDLAELQQLGVQLPGGV